MDYALSVAQESRFNALFTSPIVNDRIKKFVNRHLKGFAYDEAEIRSLAAEAAIKTFKTYPGKPDDEMLKLVIRSISNAVLNGRKALNRQKRAGGKFHIPIEEVENALVRQDDERSGGQQEGGWSVGSERQITRTVLKTIDLGLSAAYREIIGSVPSPEDYAVANQEIEKLFS